MAMQWDDSLNVGNGEIDKQHRELFERFNNLIAACRDARGKEKIVELLAFLDSYVHEHFQAEERLMTNRNFPDLKVHCAEHREFISSLKKLKESLLQEGTTLSLIVQTNQMLLTWIIRHIKSSDKSLGTYLQTMS